VCVHWDKRTCGNLGITFPIKKRINTELLLDRTVALYIGEPSIRVVTKELISPLAQAYWRSEDTLHRIAMLK